ncbi:hypothetical protein EPA93_06670 [Ktedonosporobacter rubrisoli]|uniref:Uncharacterized protein n=1 Tax=Ktedonosporobacter rubrisoli TaxID=2509675 RepID=A0A4P6JKL8_KTERU|nr:hypothetical protein [Ktedonosporobacter rubrisoli]QBD75704.1 hypothetical protein EPA93_06670 [Ktedonosporobacter rubrisoli]
MKIFVFTDDMGNVVGSFIPQQHYDPDKPEFELQGRSKDRVYEIELSEEMLVGVTDPPSLHKKLEHWIINNQSLQ